MRYILYARKSEEDKHRQVQSIDDQVKELRHLAQAKNLSIVQELREERSAKSPGNRPLFAAMIEMLKASEAEGILCWNANRLFRNPVDSGLVSWMLQIGQIKSIQTIDREYRPGDNVVVLGVESAVANQFIVDLRKGVLRGMRSKLEKGWFPHRAPLGYRNDTHLEKGAKTISKDPVLSPLIRKAWELVLTGHYTVPQILSIMNNQWGVRTPISRRGRGGNPIARATLYSLFSNPFYAGHFLHAGTLYQGAHEPMVTLAEFDEVQAIIGRKSPIKPQKHEFAFTGLVRCMTCTGMVTAELKVKPSGKRYTYYHCQGHQAPGGLCRRISIREDRLQERVKQLLAQITILPEFYEWGIEDISRWKASIQAKQRARDEQQKKSLQVTERQLAALLDMRMKELITDQEYTQKKADLTAAKVRLEQAVQSQQTAAGTIEQTLYNVLDFTRNAQGWFESGGIAGQRAVAHSLSSNYALNRGNLEIEPDPLLIPIQNGYKDLEKKYRSIELLSFRSQAAKKAALEPVRTAWSAIIDYYRTLILQHNLNFPKIDIQALSKNCIDATVNAPSLRLLYNTGKWHLYQGGG